MSLPIKIPSDDEIIREEAARLRALSPKQRIEYIHSMLAEGAMMMEVSPTLREYVREQEELGRQAIKDFLKRHAPGI